MIVLNENAKAFFAAVFDKIEEFQKKEREGENEDSKETEQEDSAADRAKMENTLGEWMKKGKKLRIEEGGEEKYILTVCTPGAEIVWVWVGTKEGEKAEILKKEEIYKFNSEEIGEGESVAEEGKNEVKKEKGEEKEENFETRVVKAKKELFENAGGKSKEELVQLIDSVEKILDGEKEKGKGKLKDKISEIRDSEFGKEKFVDGSIVYLPKDGEAIFIGDTHGDPDAAVSVIEQEKFIEAMERGEKNKYLVFLGDYVDRGSGDIENIEQIIALYEKYPDNVILLRGNHEGKETTDHDFLFSLLRKYGDKKLAESLGKYETSKTGKKTLNLNRDWIEKLHSTDNAVKELYEKYNELFEKLPGVVVCGNGIVGVHGGIPNEDIKSLKDLNNPDKLYQMRWNDPGWNDPYNPPTESKDRAESGRGKGITIFSKIAFDKFMKAVDGKVMARAHEYDSEKLIFDNKLATIFSNGKGGGKATTEMKFRYMQSLI